SICADRLLRNRTLIRPSCSLIRQSGPVVNRIDNNFVAFEIDPFDISRDSADKSCRPLSDTSQDFFGVPTKRQSPKKIPDRLLPPPARSNEIRRSAHSRGDHQTTLPRPHSAKRSFVLFRLKHDSSQRTRNSP